MDEEDFKNEIMQLKRQIKFIQDENKLLKVQNRKLQTQLDKKNKQLDAVLEPVKSQNFRAVLNDRSTSIIIEQNEKILKFEKLVREKDTFIKKLQDQLKMAKIYSQNCKQISNKSKTEEKIIKFVASLITNSKTINKDEDKIKGRPRSASWAPINECSPIPQCENNSAEDIKETQTNVLFENICNNHLLSLMENISLNLDTNRDKAFSPQSDLDRTELLHEPSSQHVEIQKLQSHFFDMFLEIDVLKSTVKKLEDEQEKTLEILKEKDNSLEEMSEVIKFLKTYKTNKSPKRPVTCKNSFDLAKIYKKRI